MLKILVLRKNVLRGFILVYNIWYFDFTNLAIIDGQKLKNAMVDTLRGENFIRIGNVELLLCK